MKRKSARSDKIVKENDDNVKANDDIDEEKDLDASDESIADQTPAKKKKADKKKFTGKKSAKHSTESENEEDTVSDELKNKKGKYAAKKASKKDESDADEENAVDDMEENEVDEIEKKKKPKRGDAGDAKHKKADKRKSGRKPKGTEEASDVENAEISDSETKKQKVDKRKSGKKSKNIDVSDSEEADQDSESERKKKQHKLGKKSKTDEVSDTEDADQDSEFEQRKSKKSATKDEGSEDDEQYEVEQVMDEKIVRGVRQYLIRWKGYGPDGDTWEPESTLNCPDRIKEFKESKSDKNDITSAEKKKSKFKKDKHKGSKKAEVDWSSSDEFEVDRILEVHFKRTGKREFLVSWKGYPSTQDSWEPEENLECSDLINKFMSKVDAAKNVNSKDLRIKRSQTERFTLQMGGGSRRLSRRLGIKQRVQYHDAE